MRVDCWESLAVSFQQRTFFWEVNLIFWAGFMCEKRRNHWSLQKTWLPKISHQRKRGPYTGAQNKVSLSSKRDYLTNRDLQRKSNFHNFQI